MAKYSPQTDYFKVANNYKKAYKVLFWLMFSFSVIFSFFNNSLVVTGISIFAIVILAILDFIVRHYTEKAEEVRRADFLDNSFGTKFVHNPSKEYYDNDGVEAGLYKMIVNVFENSLFSMEISRRMKEQELVKNIIFIIAVVCLAIYGFSRTAIALPILQLFLSKIFIVNLINICRYHSKVEQIFNEIKALFNEELEDNSQNLVKYQANILKIYLAYEANISNLKVSLNSKIYNEMNEELTKKWEGLKVRYNIKEENNGSDNDECK
ncbi:hypothetical protein [Halonatronum saccharophilum]|uniref:hypothetical protein n=1 Tax=Halonatronum saccharophilum TaxID=150060 RepID=UPI0004846BE0|nr:hypothetical protein [Halonatronum saccharophilum]